jgi:TfuA protein
MRATDAKIDPIETYVFLGPSLGRERAASILQAHYLPPIQRGDLLKVVEQGAQLVAIIDGTFYRTFSVSPFEIISALRRGVRIFGASSMGALKAVECESFGMIGVGKIFQWYRTGKLDAEDEVAITFDPETLKSLSDPLVNMRHAFSLAEKENLILRDEKNKLIRLAKSIYFPERSYHHLFSIAEKKGVPLSKLKKLKSFIKRRSCDLKALDAIACLERIRKDLSKEK